MEFDTFLCKIIISFLPPHNYVVIAGIQVTLTQALYAWNI